MTLVTRPPTGRPAWPIILLAGREKSGKSYAAAEAATSDLIHAAYWVTVGEDEPDELGLIAPDLHIVQHDGSYHAILTAIREVSQVPAVDGRPALLVLDSISMVWSMLTDEAQRLANQRAARKAERARKPAPSEDVTISMDLWNRAAGRWRRLMDALRAHPGPVILTARLAEVSVLDQNGDPTGAKDWKVEGHKTLPFDATVIVHLRSRSERYILGVRSVVWQTEPDALLPFPPGRTVPDLWRLLGLTGSGDRVHRSPDGAASLTAEDAIRTALLARLAAVSSDMGRVDAHWQSRHGEPIAEATDLQALLELTEWGEKVHAGTRPAPAAQDQPPPSAPTPPPPADTTAMETHLQENERGTHA